MAQDLVYLNYWKRQELLHSNFPLFSLLKWWVLPDFCEVEKIIFNVVKNQETVLDIGADDLKKMQKFKDAGYYGQYYTQNIGQ